MTELVNGHDNDTGIAHVRVEVAIQSGDDFGEVGGHNRTPQGANSMCRSRPDTHSRSRATPWRRDTRRGRHAVESCKVIGDAAVCNETAVWGGDGARRGRRESVGSSTALASSAAMSEGAYSCMCLR